VNSLSATAANNHANIKNEEHLLIDADAKTLETDVSKDFKNEPFPEKIEDLSPLERDVLD